MRTHMHTHKQVSKTMLTSIWQENCSRDSSISINKFLFLWSLFPDERQRWRRPVQENRAPVQLHVLHGPETLHRRQTQSPAGETLARTHTHTIAHGAGELTRMCVRRPGLATGCRSLVSTLAISRETYNCTPWRAVERMPSST